MDESEFRFADCALNPARRELLRSGVRQDIEPKPFDLLTYLLRHRDRVVTHAELMQALWPGETVTAGALARAVMLARRAVGDARDGQLIGTVARVGYRFVGDVSTAAQPRGPIALALLPFDNQTGDSQFDWVELGLMSLVGRALANEPRLVVAPATDVLAALEGLPARASALERAEAVHRLLGVRLVVLAGVGGTGGRLELRARWASGDATMPLPGGPITHVGADLTSLAAALARSLAEALLNTGSESPITREGGDSLAAEAMARALQAAAQQRWTTAVHLMKVVLDIAPDSASVKLELLRAQAALGERSAEALGQGLLDDARASGDELQQARIHQALGRNDLNLGLFRAAREHLATALRLANGREPADWTIQTLLWQSAACLRQGAWADAEHPLRAARQLCDDSGNQIHRLACLTHQAFIAASQGDLRHSMALSHEVMQRSRELRLHRYFIDAANNVAEDYLALGQLHEAAEAAGEGLAAASSVADRYRLGQICTTLCQAYYHLRRADASALVLAQVEQTGLGTAVSGDDLDLIWARAHHAAASGDSGAAADLLGTAVRRMRERGEDVLDLDLTPWWLLHATRAGRLDEVERALSERASCVAELAPMQTALDYVRAALVHARGDHGRAREMLARVIERDIGPWSALARLDAAWLAIEAGSQADARHWLDGLGLWEHQHPIAQAVNARWHLEAGQTDMALKYQRRYEAVVNGGATLALMALGPCYERAASGQPAKVPLAPWLVTLW
jgi:DNA-binding winged helix-turn-helix (wHTH) protein/tetratricopeptide (TPR) repeat protein